MITRIRTALAERRQSRRESRRMADELLVFAELERNTPLSAMGLMRRTGLGSGPLYVALYRLEWRGLIARTWRGGRVYYDIAWWIDPMHGGDP